MDALVVTSAIFFLQIIQILQFLVASPVLQPHSQRRLVDDFSGFINIDCGLAAGSQTTGPNGLSYTSDEKYISSGINMGISQTYSSVLPLYKTVRSFPEGRKNCYSLSPLTPYNKYLIRAQFLYGNYDGKNSPPGFDVYIGVNFWCKIFLLGLDASISHFKEIIHVATTESIDVCLMNTGQGTPFISVLELRPLNNYSYSAASPNASLYLWHRLDYGVSSPTGLSNNVEGDAYDRLWKGVHDPAHSKIISTNIDFDPSQAIPYRVPTKVWSTACEVNDTKTYWIFSDTTMDSTTQVCAYFHFAELKLLGSDEIREFIISAAAYSSSPYSPKYLSPFTMFTTKIALNGSGAVVFSLTKTSRSTLYPILNAFELYTIINLQVSPTNKEDADAVTEIKHKYAVPRIWQGDPCLPVNYQWDGINCTNDDDNPPRITSLSLSSSNLTGQIPPSLSNLTSLMYLNLPNNALTWEIPDFLAYLPSLKVIDLSGNNLMGPVPRVLAEKAKEKSIDLRLSGNPDVCKSYPCEEKEKRHHFIVPIVACVASVSTLVVIFGIIFLAFKRKKKQAGMVVLGKSKSSDIKPKNKQFNSSDIARITNNFRKVVGKGGFGTVYYGVLQDGTEVAVKLLNNTSSTITMKQFCIEAELLMRIHHVNLVTLIGYCDEQSNMALVYEYMSCGELQTQLSDKNKHPLSWKERIQISIDAAEGLEYLHKGCRPPIIHRDIKPANILLDEMGHAKIADFGLSRFFMDESQGTAFMTDVAGTRGYLDPEYCQLNTFSEKSDVYAFGIVLLQLLTGKQAFIKDPNIEDRRIHIINWVSPFVQSGDIMAIVDKKVQGDFNLNSAWKFLEIAMECVKPTGDERPRMSEVVANLKMCYESEGFHEQSLAVGINDGNYYMSSSRALEHKSLMSQPSAR